MPELAASSAALCGWPETSDSLLPSIVIFDRPFPAIFRGKLRK